MKVWKQLSAGQSTFVAAGTASGKTLAVAVPLFYKLFKAAGLHHISHALWMYPTIALLEDQRRILEGVGEALGLNPDLIVGELRGGMSRSQLISTLNKPVILATPDEIYWFFRKNVKYSGLLIYGLALVDEFVVDEAHLFNGLMFRNFEHLWRRIKTLSGCLGKNPRLHILTATPTDELKQLNGVLPVEGRSKGYDVNVEFRPSGRFDRADQFVNAVSEMLDAGHRKVLVVCNSARMAHQIFERYRVNDTSAIPVEHRLRFGKVKLEDLTAYLEKAGVQKELIDELREGTLDEEDVALADVPNGVELKLQLEEIVSRASEILERQCWRVRRVLWERSQRTGETWESLLANRALPCRIIAAVRDRLEQRTSVEQQQTIIDEWLTDTIEKFSNIAVDSISCKAPEFTALSDALMTAGMQRDLAFILTKRLSFEMKADPAQLPIRSQSTRPVYLRSLPAYKRKPGKISEAVKAGLESGELDVECRHVGLWTGTDVPVIVYSGSMAKQAREGLINVFADLYRAVLISTSAVEVGVDFHSDALITEECEGNSFLQRFGRVGRHSKGCKAIALLSGDTYAALAGLHGKLGREAFSTRINEVFPHRTYATGSELLDASHYLINEQLGRIGQRLNLEADLAKARPIAEQLRSADIQLEYGLRSTMPQITLRDGVTKDPFYLLRYVDDQDLRSANSPFEVARARTWFTSLIFQRMRFDVIVDLEETLRESRYLFILDGGTPKIFRERGIGLSHLSQLLKHVEWRETQALYFILLHGDVYLSRVNRELPYPEAVCDSEQNRLFIPNQTYLVLSGWTDTEKTQSLLEHANVAGWEELHYDWDRLRLDLSKGAMVILENTTGACFEAYKKLVDHAARQVQN
jgi:DEAD/DEAH box helicase domain-containing protein